jgi:hypothetical protein
VKHVENRDVSPVAELVAVAVTACPAGSAATELEKVAWPVPSVVASVEPRRVLPSPAPEGSQRGLENSSIRNEAEAVR